jgi:UDP:flavonoid glycosyltransferase YjiC (YdhE family)
MSRIALLAGPDPGHLFPVLDVAAALVRTGHEVAVWTGMDRRDVVVGAGVAFEELPLRWPDERHADLAYRLWGLAEELAPETADALCRWRPDLAVVDTVTKSGAFAAELAGVPWVELIPHLLVDPDPAVPPIGLGRRPSSNPLRRADDRRIRRHQAVSLDRGRSQRAAARDRVGLTGEGRPVARLVGTFPSLEYPRSRWPGDTHIVGPLGWDVPAPPLDPPDGDEPLVVVTDSSASTVPEGLGRRALVGLRHTGVRLAVVTRQELAPWPAGCVVGWGPHAPLFDAAAVVVTPGGAGTLGKAFTRGVPVVVAPLQGDQFEAAGRVAAVGAGRRLPPWQQSPRWLRTAVLAVVHDGRYRAAARRLQQEAVGLGADHAAALVTALARGDRPVARGPQR